MAGSEQQKGKEKAGVATASQLEEDRTGQVEEKDRQGWAGTRKTAG